MDLEPSFYGDSKLQTVASDDLFRFNFYNNDLISQRMGKL